MPLTQLGSSVAAPPHRHAPAAGRDPALDLLRAVALGRVVLWHAFAAPWMTAFTAIPLMFFVTGTLLGPGESSRRYRVVLGRRLRRVLLPLWVYGVVVAAAGAHLHADGATASVPSWDVLWRALTWVLPFVDPAGSDWHGGWFSNHLWYIRAYVWVLALYPVFAAFARKAGLAACVLGLLIVQLEVATATGVPFFGRGQPRVVLGDLATYGLFVVLGIAHARRTTTPARRTLAVAAASAGAGAFAFAVAFGVPRGGVNESYPLLALCGLFWLFAAGACEDPIRRLVSAGRLRTTTRTVCRRAVTIYLWHPAAIVGAYALVGDGFAFGPVAVVIVTLLLTAIAVAVVGWVEDVAAVRRPRVSRTHRARRGRSAALAVGVLVLAVVVPTIVVPSADADPSSRGRRIGILPPPSNRAALADSAFATRIPSPPPTTRISGPLPRGALATALREWFLNDERAESVAVAVAGRGELWVGDAARRNLPSETPAHSPYGIASLTKTFTLALVLQQVEAGRLDLDAPMPTVRGVRRPARATAITPRQLLQHTSGLVNYADAVGYRPDRRLTPRQAVRLSLNTPLAWAPGTQVEYSNIGYLYLGLLLETLTGRPYGDLISDLASSVGLAETRLDAEDHPGWTGYSSGGVRSTVGDLARWGEALFTPGRVLSVAMVRELTTLGEHNLGAGTWPLCPCATDETGRKRYKAIGHHVGHGGLYHYPGEVTVAIHVLPVGDHVGDQVASLGEALRAAARRQR